MIYNLDSLIAELERWQMEPAVSISRETVRQILVVLSHVKKRDERSDDIHGGSS